MRPAGPINPKNHKIVRETFHLQMSHVVWESTERAGLAGAELGQDPPQ